MTIEHRASTAPPQRPQRAAPGPDLSDKDSALLESLREAGADLSEPRQVLYFLYFDSQESAAAAADVARSEGFQTEVGEDSSDQWSVMCEKRSVVLTKERVLADSSLFERIASAHGGQFDGWQASV